jgi:hypothetical protein
MCGYFSVTGYPKKAKTPTDYGVATVKSSKIPSCTDSIVVYDGGVGKPGISFLSLQKKWLSVNPVLTPQYVTTKAKICEGVPPSLRAIHVKAKKTKAGNYCRRELLVSGGAAIAVCSPTIAQQAGPPRMYKQELKPKPKE